MKSQVKLLVSIMSSLRHDWDCAISSRDVMELSKRATMEGLPYISSTLPTIDDHLLRWLSTGHATFSDMDSRSRPYPRFLSGLWEKVFYEDGSLRPHPCKRSIFAIRQISRAFKKVFEVCSDDKVESSMTHFIETDGSLPTEFVETPLRRVNAVLHGRELFKISQKGTFNFSHGPGATAERLDSVARWDFPTVSPGQARRFDMSDYFRTYTEDWPVPVREQVGRVVAVPKTFDKPRLISIEPASAIYTQKGILSDLDDWMRNVPQINMRDQSRNRSLALEGSKDGGLSTIDLSEASDRVSVALVREVFSLSGDFFDLIMAARTGIVDVNGRTLRLRKFASMGCALTFPIQMLVFRTIIISAMCEHDRDMSRDNILRHGRSRDVGVFGDDIIVPTRYAQPVMSALKRYGLVVNEAKSFTTGLFRESCGGDYFGGTSVKPVYLRRQPPTNRHDVDAIVSYAATSILFSEIGLDGAAKHLSSMVEELIGPSPEAAGGIAVSHPTMSKERYNVALQRHEVLANISIPRRKRVSASDEAVLAAALHAAGTSVGSYDPLRLTHHGRPTSAFISRRWAPQH